MARGFSLFVGIGAKLLPSLNSAPGAIERRFGQMNRNLQLQAAKTKVAFKEMSAAMNPLLGMAAAGGLSFGFEKAIENSSHLTHELQNLRNAGRSANEVAQAMSAANRTIAALPTTTLIDNLKVLNETTGAFGNFQHAVDNLTFNQRVGSMMQNMLGDKAGEPGEMFNSLVRAMEIRGATQDHARYQREVGELYKGFIFTGGKVNPEEFLHFSQQANPYTKGMSLRYLSRVVPSLIQEFGGDKAGTMQNTWAGTILGKSKNIMQTQAWLAQGLLDPTKVVYNKQGNAVGWKPGAVKNTSLALTDPLAWTEQVQNAALRSHGIVTSDTMSLMKALMPMYRDRNAFRLAMGMTYDQDNRRLHKDEGLINGVPDVNKASEETLRRDPLQAWTALKDSFSNLSSVLFGTGEKESPVAVALVDVGKGVNFLATTLEAHPLLANGAGIMLGLSAATATVKVFGVSLRWLMSPLKILMRPLSMLGGVLWRALGPAAFKAFLRFGTFIRSGIMRLGPLLLEGFSALAPIVGEGVMGAFALLSNPVGWTVLAVAAAVAAGALIFHFRKQIGGWISRSWGWIKNTFTSLDWASIGKALAWALADGMTFGLASKLPALASWWKGRAPTWLGGSRGAAAAPGFRFDRQGSRVAGHRAMGGSVLGGGLYLVGERGPELFRAPMSGSIVTANRTAAMLREASRGRRVPVGAERDRRGRGSVRSGGDTYNFTINGVNDPEQVGRVVELKLRRMAGAQNAMLSD